MGKSAEQLHRQILKHVLGVRGSTATPVALAEFGRYLACFHWWQQILQYHGRISNLPDDESVIQCAFVQGLHDQAYCFWGQKVQTWLQLQSTCTALEIDSEDAICVCLALHAACLLQQLTSVDCFFLDKDLSSVLGLCKVAVCLAQAALKCKHVTSLKATEPQTQQGHQAWHAACMLQRLTSVHCFDGQGSQQCA